MRERCASNALLQGTVCRWGNYEYAFRVKYQAMETNGTHETSLGIIPAIEHCPNLWIRDRN